MELTFRELDKFYQEVNYVSDGRAYDLNLEVRDGCNVRVVFYELKKLQKMGLANESSSITFNGLNLVAGIYNTPDEFMNLFICIRNNDRNGIIESFQGKTNAYALVEAFRKINSCLSMLDYPIFTQGEEVEIIRNLCSSSHKKK